MDIPEPKADGLYMFECCTDRYILERDTFSAELAGYRPGEHWSYIPSSACETWQDIVNGLDEECHPHLLSMVMLQVRPGDKETFNTWPMQIQKRTAKKAYFIRDCRDEISGLNLESMHIDFQDFMYFPHEIEAVRYYLKSHGFEPIFDYNSSLSPDGDFIWVKEIV